MDRRKFLQASGAAVMCGSLPLWAMGRPTPKKPNVLFIAIDDLNDWIGCLGGHPDTKTPNLDRLAARGVLFTNAHCAAPACNPSRAALMTGVRPSTSGVYVNSQPWRNSPVLADAVTLSQHFMANGYRALGSGKIYHGAFPDPQSWDEYWPSKTKQHPDDPEPEEHKKPLAGKAGQGHFDWGRIDVSKEDMGDWKVTDWVIGRLKEKHDKPFFLACGIYKPHLPWYMPQEYLDRFPLENITLPDVKDDDLDDIPPAGREMAKSSGDHRRVTDAGIETWKKAVQGYLACISYADDCVGKVLDALDASEYKDNTTIVLWSDHGWHLGEKLHWRKFALWEEATHNVLMFAAPGVTEPGGRCSAPVSLLDIYPTLMDLCGMEKKQHLEGQSLVNLLKNPAADRDEPAVTTHGYTNHSVRTSRFRYIRYEDGGEELYDHQTDPMEWTNLAADPKHAKTKNDLAKWLPKKNFKFNFNEKKKRK